LESKTNVECGWSVVGKVLTKSGIKKYHVFQERFSGPNKILNLHKSQMETPDLGFDFLDYMQSIVPLYPLS
jgi:hypothetical protein